MKTYVHNHQPIPFTFTQSISRFHVSEIPLFRPSGNGSFLLLNIKKYDISTFRLLNVIKEATGASDREIGYAGLKDKNATAIQSITLPKKYEKFLKNITTDRIEILEKNYNRSPIKIGQLGGNSFEIILTDISPRDSERFVRIGKAMMHGGIPNYFGYQRFGEDGKSWQQGREIAHSGKRLKGAKEKLLVSAYQSHLFNQWLSQRVSLSKTLSEMSPTQAAKSLNYPDALVHELRKQPQFLKLFLGDVTMEYPRGKLRHCRDMMTCADAFERHKIAPTGLLAGDHALRSESDARHLEEPYDDDELISLRGDRRLAWVWPGDLDGTYDSRSRSLTIHFTLPGGAYATTLLEEIGRQRLLPGIGQRQGK